MFWDNPTCVSKGHVLSLCSLVDLLTFTLLIINPNVLRYRMPSLFVPPLTFRNHYLCFELMLDLDGSIRALSCNTAHIISNNLQNIVFHYETMVHRQPVFTPQAWLMHQSSQRTNLLVLLRFSGCIIAFTSSMLTYFCTSRTPFVFFAVSPWSWTATLLFHKEKWVNQFYKHLKPFILTYSNNKNKILSQHVRLIETSIIPEYSCKSPGCFIFILSVSWLAPRRLF